MGITCRIRESHTDWYGLAKSHEDNDYDFALAAIDLSFFGRDPDTLINFMYGDNFITNNLDYWSQAPNTRFPELMGLLNEARKSETDSQYY